MPTALLLLLTCVLGVSPQTAQRYPGKYPIDQAWAALSANSPETQTGDEWLTHVWSWALWWEANREEFLAPGAAGPGAPAGPAKVLAAEPNDVGRPGVQALREALTDERPAQVRAAAALALGRIEDSISSPRLVELTAD